MDGFTLTTEQLQALHEWLDDVEHYSALRLEGGDDEYGEDDCSEAIDVAFEEIATILLDARKGN